MDDFDKIIDREFLATMEPDTDTDVVVYGLRILYYHPDDTTKHLTVLVPWLSYSLERAEQMRHGVATSDLLMRMALRRFLADEMDTPAWVPMAVRIVQLTEIPF